MSSKRFTRGVALLGGLAVAGGALAACSTDTKTEPVKTSQSNVAPSSSGAPSPTEKAVSPITPGNGGNSFSPQITARPAPTALPGNVITGN
jgi:hypothetical protein